MGTQRATGRAGDDPRGDHPTTRWLLGTPALVLCLALTGCATSVSGTGPEVIPYCAEAAQAPRGGGASTCIPRP